MFTFCYNLSWDEHQNKNMDFAFECSTINTPAPKRERVLYYLNSAHYKIFIFNKNGTLK